MLLAWRFDPLIMLLLVLAAGLYVRGWRRLGKRAHGLRILPTWRAWAYAAGWSALVLAFLSPIDTFDGVLFWVHMLQHLLLIQVAAPLLLLGSPLLPLLWGLPGDERRGVAH